MLLPIKVKNPPRSFPIITVSLIVMNLIVYALTTESFLVIYEHILKTYGYAAGVTPFYTAFTAMFLHGDIFHILGNMWFLWLFGPSVEERLKPGMFLVMYFAAGLVGHFLQLALGTFSSTAIYNIGASGCIMGVLGAYWYLFSWSTVCVFYWIGLWWHGIWEVAAIWIIGLYFLMDLGKGLLFRSFEVSGGVAHFAHVGGVLAGLGICLVLRLKRDSEQMSEARAIHADMKDLSLLPLHAVQTMLREDPTNPELLRAVVKPSYNAGQTSYIRDAMVQAGPVLIDKDPGFVAYYLLTLRGDISIYPPTHLLRLAGLLERNSQAPDALQVYRLIADKNPTSQDAETSLYRMANCYWVHLKDVRNAKMTLHEMAKRFPNGPMTSYGRTLWKQMESANP